MRSQEVPIVYILRVKNELVHSVEKVTKMFLQSFKTIGIKL